MAISPTVLAPIAVPRVGGQPIRDAILDAPADQLHRMTALHSAISVLEDDESQNLLIDRVTDKRFLTW
jgi:hypothetical protein